MEAHVKEYTFVRKPQIGDIVKVYMTKTECCVGRVCDYFLRTEHRLREVTPTGKVVEPYDIVTECVMLTRIEEIEFFAIGFFLDISRVDFKIN